MKIIIFGLGSIGVRHAQILRKDFKHELYAFRSGKTSKENLLKVPELSTWESVDRLKPEIAFITNPTSEHLSTALECAQRGMHLFIEKPLADSLDGASQLIALCHKKKLSAYVAYCLRFHPVIIKIKELLKDKKALHARVVCSSMLHAWRPGSDPKKSYSARRALGGGVILDLSHEFDYIRFLLGEIKSITGIKGRMGHVTVDSEDFADTLLTLENGVIVNCHLNFASFQTERKIQIDFKQGFIEGDLINNTIICQARGKIRHFRFSVDRNAYLKTQTEYFFKNLKYPDRITNLRESQILLEKILEFRNA